MDDPKSVNGFMHWGLLGVGGAILALLVAYAFPSMIPAKSAATRL